MTRLLLVASSGGHLLELSRLSDFYQSKSRAWVTFPTSDARSILSLEQRVYWAHYPTTRNLPNLMRNQRLAVKIMGIESPDVVISTGAAIAVPFLAEAKRRGIRTIYIESIARVSSLSLTAKLVADWVDEFWVQWPEATQLHRRAQYHGRVI